MLKLGDNNVLLEPFVRGPLAKGVIMVLLGILILGVIYFFLLNYQSKTIPSLLQSDPAIPTPTITPSPTITLISPQSRKILSNDYHIFQTFNNCGPAALSMALSYYGININQQDLGQDMRPYQIPGGDNDDKSVTLEELAEKSREYELIPYHSPNGNIDLIKLFINYDIPVIARTLTKVNEDIGHYRVIKGYSDGTGEIIQDDSLQGKNLRYSYEDLNKLWEKFNFEYLVLVPQNKQDIAEAILGEDRDPQIAWKKAAANAQNLLMTNPSDITTRFNYSVALYNIGAYQQSVEEFEKIENSLPFRTLWYQIEPIQAYYELGNYERIFSLTDRILNNYNRAFSELYLIRGEIYKKEGNMEAARNEFQKAVFYNKNLTKAQEALSNLR